MRILIVDDDKVVQNNLKPALESECFEVDQAESCEEGILLATTNIYDLIILDSNLPKKSGSETCSGIRDENKKVPIIILSVVTETTAKVKLLNIGADDYMTKPYSFEELLARIRALLRRSYGNLSEVVKVGDLIIDSAAHTVKRNGKEIHLTAKEFMLLECLARNAGKVVSRGDILEHVWDMNADPFSNTIEVHIANLRRKVGGKDKTKLLKTVPGIGYKIEVNS